MKLKLCGIRTPQMLQFCEDQGVEYVGINFVGWSQRSISLEEAQSLLSRPRGKTKRIAVFMDNSLEEMAEILEKVSFDGIQLHGKENAMVLQKLKKYFPELEVWKTFSVELDFDTNIMQQYCNNCDKFLFDGKNPGSGKLIVANEKLHESIAEAEKLGMFYGIAGGVNASNIADFKKVFHNAQFLDTASGIEKNEAFDQVEAQKLVNAFKKI